MFQVVARNLLFWKHVAKRCCFYQQGRCHEFLGAVIIFDRVDVIIFY